MVRHRRTISDVQQGLRRSPRLARRNGPKESPSSSGGQLEPQADQGSSAPSKPVHLEHPERPPAAVPETTVGLQPTPLTERALRLFNKMASKGQNNASQLPTGEKSDETPTSVITTTSSAFTQKAVGNGILREVDSMPATNLDSIRQILAKPRYTPVPTRSRYDRYRLRAETSKNEQKTALLVTSMFMKEYEDEYDDSMNTPFSGLPKHQGFNNGLSAPKPDWAAGLTIQAFKEFRIEDRVAGGAVFHNDPSSLAIPHIAGEYKSLAGNLRQARSQSAYDGAALVHGRNQALSAIGESDSPGHAKITTFTTDGTQLSLFAHHAVPSSDGKTRYHQSRISSHFLTASHDQFLKAYQEFRNAQDMSRETACKLRDALDKYAVAEKNPPTTEGQDDVRISDQQLDHEPTSPPSEARPTDALPVGSEPDLGNTTPSLPQPSDCGAPTPPPAGQGRKRRVTSPPSSPPPSTRRKVTLPPPPPPLARVKAKARGRGRGRARGRGRGRGRARKR